MFTKLMPAWFIHMKWSSSWFPSELTVQVHEPENLVGPHEERFAMMNAWSVKGLATLSGYFLGPVMLRASVASRKGGSSLPAAGQLMKLRPLHRCVAVGGRLVVGVDGGGSFRFGRHA